MTTKTIYIKTEKSPPSLRTVHSHGSRNFYDYLHNFLLLLPLLSLSMIRFIPHSFLPCYFFYQFHPVLGYSCFFLSIHFLNSYEVCGLHTSRSWSRRLARRTGVWAKSRAKWVSFSLWVACCATHQLLTPIRLHLWPLCCCSVGKSDLLAGIRKKITSFSRLWLVFRFSSLPRRSRKNIF